MNRQKIQAQIKEILFIGDYVKPKTDIQVLKVSDLNDFCPYDFIYLSGNSKTENITEVKMRNCGVNEYPTTLIEQSKYNRLMNFKSYSTNIIYISVHPDCVLFFDLSNFQNLRFKPLQCPYETNGDTTSITKQVALLPNNRAFERWDMTIDYETLNNKAKERLWFIKSYKKNDKARN